MSLVKKEYQDSEFGVIAISKSHRSRSVSISLKADGGLKINAPSSISISEIRQIIDSSRDKIRAMAKKSIPSKIYQDGDRIGKNHFLIINFGEKQSARISGSKILIKLIKTQKIADADSQIFIRQQVTKALRQEAKDYLPKRIAILSQQTGFKYHALGFSHATSRWGSCSSKEKITLNIALMKLPFELIDYVLIHELCHLKQMNHSEKFWSLVAEFDPNYQNHKSQIKKYTPII